MDNLKLAFTPDLPLWLIIAVCLLIAGFCIYGVATRTRGSFFRLIAVGLLGLALFNPAILQEDRTALKTIIPLIIDENHFAEI